MGNWWKPDSKTESNLVRAGFDGSTAAVTWGAVRVATVVVVPLLAFFVPTKTLNQTMLLVISGRRHGYVLPSFYLARTLRLRQERIVRSLPDVMDLLVLCVEAGLGFDAAVLRVARNAERPPRHRQ